MMGWIIPAVSLIAKALQSGGASGSSGDAGLPGFMQNRPVQPEVRNPDQQMENPEEQRKRKMLAAILRQRGAV